MKKQNKAIGIIGGMGPYASAYFYKLLLDKSRDRYGAKNNKDYPEILIDSVPIPDFISDTRNLKKAGEILLERVKKNERLRSKRPRYDLQYGPYPLQRFG